MENKIDELYEKVLNSDVREYENVLSDEDVDLIASELDNLEDPIMAEAKEMASTPNLTDKEFEGVVSYNNETGVAMDVKEIDYNNVVSFDELLNSENVQLPDIDADLTITKIAISNFFALEFSDEAFEKAGITDEVCKKLEEITEKYRILKITGKKFSYFNAMPDSIKSQIIMFHGVAAADLTGRNMLKTARNFIAASLMEHILVTKENETLTIDLEQAITKLNEKLKNDTEELATDEEWSKVTWKYYLKTIPVQASLLESKGMVEEAEKYKKVIATFKETCTFKSLINDITNYKLKLRKIDLEDFDKYCESFNSQYAESEYTIHDVKLAYNTLCANPNIEGDEELYKYFIAYFIAYCSKYNFSTNNIYEHEFMYYFIWNIISANMYNKEDKEDVEFHNSYMRALQNALNIVKRMIE